MTAVEVMVVAMVADMTVTRIPVARAVNTFPQYLWPGIQQFHEPA